MFEKKFIILHPKSKITVENIYKMYSNREYI